MMTRAKTSAIIEQSDSQARFGSSMGMGMYDSGDLPKSPMILPKIRCLFSLSS